MSDQPNADFRRRAAMALSDLLCSTLNCPQRALYVWEKDAMRCILEQWAADPGTPINMWTADRVREFERGDLVRCAGR